MNAKVIPRVTFGIILLNGQPFIRYNLRAIYPFAHEIIVVEGAVPGAASLATPDGHSTDGSLNELYRFKYEEDPGNKLIIISKDEFWAEKDEMSQAYAKNASGDYLWQVDIDEFYQPGDMKKILRLLNNKPEISAVFFKQITFWGGFDYIADGWYLRQKQFEGPGIIPRIFRWKPGYQYLSHRPVTIVDENDQNVAMLKSLNGWDLANQGIYMYHYSLLFPKQVAEKSAYYSRANWADRDKSEQWAQQIYNHLENPYRVHNVYQYPSWLEKFKDKHPPQIEALRKDIEVGKVEVSLRPTADIEQLLKRPSYKLGRLGLKIMDPFVRRIILFRRKWKRRRQ